MLSVGLNLRVLTGRRCGLASRRKYVPFKVGKAAFVMVVFAEESAGSG